MAKKKLLRRIFTTTLLATFVVVLFVTPALAQDVRLLPNASGDYGTQTTPYEGQNYRIRTANPDGPLDLVRAIIENPLGTFVSNLFGFASENMMQWVGDLMHFALVNVHTAIGGEAGLTGTGYCRARDNVVVENNCREGYKPVVVDDFCQCVRDTSAAINPSDYGAIGIIGGMSTGLLQQSPPDLHTAAYFKQELADNIFSPAPAYAQTGLSYFDPIIGIAQIVRNLGYVFMVAVLILMGLMVMFRARIDPRTTMTASAALPRIAASLVLIAFSYPLAGILVDLGRLLKAMIDALFGDQMTLHPVEPFQMIVDLIGNFFAVSVFNPISWFMGGNINLGGTGFFALLISVGLMIIAVAVAFMLFFTLVFRFATLYAQVIFAPLAFAWGALPGQEDTISRWFKSFAVNVLTFPAIYLLVNLANYIAVTSMHPGAAMPLPEDMGWGTVSTFIGGTTNVGGLVAFGLLVTATRVPAMLEDAFEVSAPAAVAKAGVEPGKIISKVPLVGGFFK